MPPSQRYRCYCPPRDERFSHLMVETRVHRQFGPPGPKADTPKGVVETISSVFPEMINDTREHIVVLLLNTRLNVAGVYRAAMGGVRETSCDPGTILRAAILTGTQAFILVHNHPGGDVEPSLDDHKLTAGIAEAARILRMRLLDHVILAPTGEGVSIFSYAEKMPHLLR